MNHEFGLLTAQFSKVEDNTELSINVFYELCINNKKIADLSFLVVELIEEGSKPYIDQIFLDGIEIYNSDEYPTEFAKTLQEKLTPEILEKFWETVSKE